MGQLLLVRHGQASFGADDYDVLSEIGWAQGRALGSWLASTSVTPTVVVRGDMRRHRETLEAMIEAAGWTDLNVTADSGWDEFDHVGIVASYPDLPADPTTLGQDRRTFQRAFEQATTAWTSGTHGGDIETYAWFLERVRGSLVGATAAAGSGETVLVVTSGGPIAAACAVLVDPDNEDQALTARLWSRFNTVVVNAAVTRVVVGSTGARLLTFNEHPHLAGELLTYR